MAEMHDVWCDAIRPEGGKCNCSHREIAPPKDYGKPVITPARQRSGFEPVRVSAAAYNKIADLEQAMQRLLIAKTHPEQAEAYSVLNEARKALYMHVEALEQTAGIRRTVQKRF